MIQYPLPRSLKPFTQVKGYTPLLSLDQFDLSSVRVRPKTAALCHSRLPPVL